MHTNYETPMPTVTLNFAEKKDNYEKSSLHQKLKPLVSAGNVCITFVFMYRDSFYNGLLHSKVTLPIL